MTSETNDTGFELDEAVCICSGTTKRKIIQLIEEGCDLDTVSRKTGAYSGCGGCEYDLELLFAAYKAKD